MHFFSGNLSTGTGLVINFDLVKYATKININSYPIYNGNVAGGLSPEYRHKQNVFPWYIQSEVSSLMSCSLEVTQYMHQPTRQLYSIWMSDPKALYRW